ncbi:hypothetical protein [Nitrosococcus wardiae]|uniref:hypothetical protein n=1 Tax=Nitrosococcus wardiae TaxID=1814290 RepID=UPI00141B7DE7|nr:hypothetical protein [Nitrosococcus wardiae]
MFFDALGYVSWWLFSAGIGKNERLLCSLKLYPSYSGCHKNLQLGCKFNFKDIKKQAITD